MRREPEAADVRVEQQLDHALAYHRRAVLRVDVTGDHAAVGGDRGLDEILGQNLTLEPEFRS